MDKSLSRTPAASRTHIGFFGRMNAGKSSLINALTRQSVSIVSPRAGTTTDVVKKAIEIHGIGPCVLLDTAGFDDSGETGGQCVRAARRAAEAADVAVMLFVPGDDWAQERSWTETFRSMSTPVIAVAARADERSDDENRALRARIRDELGLDALEVSAATGAGVDALRARLVETVARGPEKRFILGDLIDSGDTVVMVMPQDPQAPEGRLILPEVQTLREALDRHCVAVCVQPEELPAALARLQAPPKLIVTDSQVFDAVYAHKPAQTKLTSFSVLFAGFKGDLPYYMESVGAIRSLTEDSRVLIAECCTHAPLDEDIGRVKIPNLLRKRVGPGLRVDIAAGTDFPEDPSGYDLIIQCGGCMFNRKYVCARINRAKAAGVPMTNYGITIAYLKGILDRVDTGRSE